MALRFNENHPEYAPEPVALCEYCKSPVPDGWNRCPNCDAWCCTDCGVWTEESEFECKDYGHAVYECDACSERVSIEEPQPSGKFDSPLNYCSHTEAP